MKPLRSRDVDAMVREESSRRGRLQYEIIADALRRGRAAWSFPIGAAVIIAALIMACPL